MAARVRRCRSSVVVLVLLVSCCGAPSAPPNVVGVYRGDRPGVAIDMIELLPSGKYQLTHTKSPVVGGGLFWGGTYRVEGSALLLLEHPESRAQIPEQRYAIVVLNEGLRLEPAKTNKWPYKAVVRLSPGPGWR